MKAEEKITLVGAGLVGSLLSLYLSRRGFEVQIFEGRPDMRVETVSAGRSINLALSTRGIHSLHELGLEREVLNLAIPMMGRMVHSVKGDLDLQRYGRDDSEYINSVSRGGLNKLLMDYAEKTGRVKINFNKRVKSVDLKNKTLTFEKGEGDDQANHGQIQDLNAQRGNHPDLSSKYDILIGTDGSASAVRHAMAKLPGYQATEEYLNYGYKELVIPAGPHGTFMLEKNALHIWPRGTYMLIALPNLDGSFTATLFLPSQGELSFDHLKTPSEVQKLFKDHFADILPVFPGLIDEFFAHPVGHMVTVKTSPWNFKNEVLLLGDAAHAIVPFFGQGMNCGFEDCSILNQILDRDENNWTKIFAEFSGLRKKDTDAIADLAVENFIEMRDKVGQSRFVLEKNVERILHKSFPDDYISRYQLVTFTRVPYAVAAKAGHIQNEILSELCHDLTRAEDVDLVRAEKLVKDKFTGYLKSYKKELYGF